MERLDPEAALMADAGFRSVVVPLHARHVHGLIGPLPAQDRRELRRLLGGLREHLE